MAKKINRKKGSCKNHPSKKTIHRCYQCKDYICRDCIIRTDHHYFCSENCIQSYRRSIRYAKLIKFKDYLKSHFGIRDIIYVTVIGLIIISYGVILNKPTAQIPAQDSLRTIPPTKADSLWKPFIYVDEFRIHIDESIPENMVLGVWVNNHYLQTIINDSVVEIRANELIPGDNEIFINAISKDKSYLLYKTTLTINKPRYKSLDYARLPGKKKQIALTFDAGSNDGAVDSILAILKKYDVPATAFLTGIFMKTHPEKVMKLVKSGRFEFGHHTWSHPHLTSYEQNKRHDLLPGVTFDLLKEEFAKTDSLFYHLSGFHLNPIWRAPYGEYNSQILQWCGHLGFTHIGWSRGFDTFDWVTDTTSIIYYTPDELWTKWLNRFEEEEHRFKGAIILMHLGNDRIKPMYSMLHQLIPMMQRRGYQFVTISQGLEERLLSKTQDIK